MNLNINNISRINTEINNSNSATETDSTDGNAGLINNRNRISELRTTLGFEPYSDLDDSMPNSSFTNNSARGNDVGLSNGVMELSSQTNSNGVGVSGVVVKSDTSPPPAALAFWNNFYAKGSYSSEQSKNNIKAETELEGHNDGKSINSKENSNGVVNNQDIYCNDIVYSMVYLLVSGGKETSNNEWFLTKDDLINIKNNKNYTLLNSHLNSQEGVEEGELEESVKRMVNNFEELDKNRNGQLDNDEFVAGIEFLMNLNDNFEANYLDRDENMLLTGGDFHNIFSMAKQDRGKDKSDFVVTKDSLQKVMDENKLMLISSNEWLKHSEFKNLEDVNNSNFYKRVLETASRVMENYDVIDTNKDGIIDQNEQQAGRDFLVNLNNVEIKTDKNSIKQLLQENGIEPGIRGQDEAFINERLTLLYSMMESGGVLFAEEITPENIDNIKKNLLLEVMTGGGAKGMLPPDGNKDYYQALAALLYVEENFNSVDLNQNNAVDKNEINELSKKNTRQANTRQTKYI
jgi:hypothetical protein